MKQIEEIKAIANQYRDDQVVTIPAPYFKRLIAALEFLLGEVLAAHDADPYIVDDPREKLCKILGGTDE